MDTFGKAMELCGCGCKDAAIYMVRTSCKAIKINEALLEAEKSGFDACMFFRLRCPNCQGKGYFSDGPKHFVSCSRCGGSGKLENRG